MKKILSTALMFIILAATTVDTINAARTESPTEERGRSRERVTEEAAVSRGRSRSRSRSVSRSRSRSPKGKGAARVRSNATNVQSALDTAKKTDNPVVKAEAIKTANEFARELLDSLTDSRTWAGDVLGKYSPQQVSIALQKYTDLEIQRKKLMESIEIKQADLDAMSTKSWVFWTKAEGGKEAVHEIASKELAEMKSTLKDVNKAMRNQAVIAGKEYCATIRMAVGALTAAGVAGLAYGIDKYQYKGAGMEYLGEKYTSARKELAMLPEETYVGYGTRGLSNAYGAVTTKVSDFYKGVTGLTVQSVKDYVASFWTAKDKPANIKQQEQITTNAIIEKNKAQTDLDKAKANANRQPENPIAQDNVEKKEIVLENKEEIVNNNVAKLEEMVVEEVTPAPTGAGA